MKKFIIIFFVTILLASCGTSAHYYLKQYNAVSNRITNRAKIGLVLSTSPDLENAIIGEFIKFGFNVKPLYFINSLVLPLPKKNILPKTRIGITSPPHLEKLEIFLRREVYKGGIFSYEHDSEIEEVFKNIKRIYDIDYLLFGWETRHRGSLRSGANFHNIKIFLINVNNYSLDAYQKIAISSPAPLNFSHYRKLVRYVVIQGLIGEKPIEPNLHFGDTLIELKEFH